MNFFVTNRVFEKMPNVCFGLVRVKGIDNSHRCDFVEEMLNNSIASCREHFEGKIVKQEKDCNLIAALLLSLELTPISI